MAAPKDGVFLQKSESTATGGDSADNQQITLTGPLEFWEDAPYVQGIFYQPPSAVPVDPLLVDKAVYSGRDNAGNMLFRDPNANGGTEVTLSALLGGGFDINTVLIDDITGNTLSDNVTGNLLVGQ